jgi:hypothetical protein
LLPVLLLSPACGEASHQHGSVTALSQSGVVEAQVQFQGSVRRGENDLTVQLSAPSDVSAAPALTGVEAYMPAHGHQAHTDDVAPLSHGFRASRLDLFMTGRWQVELLVESEGESDRVGFAVDVP